MHAIGEITFGDAMHGDGFVGEVSRLVVDPVGRVLTHVVVAPRHESGQRRLVPAQLIGRADEGAGDELRLHCTKQEYEALTPATGTQVVVDASGDGLPLPSQTLRRSTRAYALDGGLGRVRGLSVDDGAITHYLIRSGMLGRRRTVAVPVAVVRDVGEGVHIGMTKHQIRTLAELAPPVRTVSESTP